MEEPAHWKVGGWEILRSRIWVTPWGGAWVGTLRDNDHMQDPGTQPACSPQGAGLQRQRGLPVAAQLLSTRLQVQVFWGSLKYKGEELGLWRQRNPGSKLRPAFCSLCGHTHATHQFPGLESGYVPGTWWVSKEVILELLLSLHQAMVGTW